ncbi:MAG: hypothetical protein CMB80_13120 [Flammeovirgaceae bacterium]|nr:hypothetical protein [Flammeovirgaceae bacterium]MBR08767.1 hypothetical protein [Rickettsiales bacterium]HCX24578.1 hypothetical protein [Cytophagales bacterium]|tara:strand:+ start:252 stop:1103 length:852 start_codon:yes stop_codon:yes gene_type:complete
MRQYFVIFILILGASIRSLAGGGWVYGKNQGYFKLAENVIRSPYYFDGDGNIVDIPTISLYTTSLYAEYGFGNNLSVVAYVPFFVRSTLNKVVFNQSGDEVPGEELSAFGDSEVALKYGWNQDKPIVFAASLVLGLPVGSSEVSSEKILQTGDGEFNQMIQLEASHSFYPKPFYATAFVAFNNRTNDFSDEVRFGGEIGYTGSKLIAILKLKSVQSMYNGLPNGQSNAEGSMFGNNIEYVSITPEMNYSLSESFGISASAGFAPAAKNQLASPNFSLGLYYQL